MKKTMIFCLFIYFPAFIAWGGGNGEAEATMEDGKTKVVFWSSHSLGDYEGLKEIVANFNSSQDEIEVEVVKVAGSETETTKLMTAVVGGVGPDVYFLDRFTIPQRASEGLLVDITEYVDQENNLEANYLPYAWQEVVYNNKVYGLPFDTDARVLYYNRDMIREAGYDPAEFDKSNGPLSIERFKEISFAMNEMDDSGAYTRIGFNPFIEQAWHYTWLYAFGADIYDEVNQKITLAQNKQAIDAFAFLYEWAEDMGPQKNSTWESTYLPPNLSPGNHPFFTGRLGAFITGDWFLKNLEDYGENVDWGITYIPTPDKSMSSWSGGWSMVIPAGSRVVDEAYKFIRYFTSEDGQEVYVRETSHLPTWKSLLNEDSLYGDSHRFFKDILPHSNSRPPLAVGALLWDQLSVVQDKMGLNQEKAIPALKEAEKTVNQRLENLR